MHVRLRLLLIAAVALVALASRDVLAKPRVVVLTDIENEPDDAMSLVRFLVYSNQWDVEGLVATTSVHQQNRVAAERIREIVQAYARVRANLALHEPGFPTASHLLSVVREGRAAHGLQAVGAGMDSSGSERILHVLERSDPRPVWVLVWGGPNCLAQALWKARQTRSPQALAELTAKLRVYAISDQDDSGPWIRENFPGVFYIASPGFHPLGGYHHATSHRARRDRPGQTAADPLSARDRRRSAVTASSRCRARRARVPPAQRGPSTGSSQGTSAGGLGMICCSHSSSVRRRRPGSRCSWYAKTMPA